MGSDWASSWSSEAAGKVESSVFSCRALISGVEVTHGADYLALHPRPAFGPPPPSWDTEPAFQYQNDYGDCGRLVEAAAFPKSQFGAPISLR